MTLQASIQLQDRMSRVLNGITQSMAVMMNTFEETRARTDAGFNAAAMDAARQGIVQASAELVRYNEELRRAATIPPPTVPQPTWNSVRGPDVIMSSGAERFQAEFRAANQAAHRLMQTQQAISTRARNMTITPPGMLNDVIAVENRMRGLTQRVQQLNDIPISLRTEQINRELESLRGQLGRAASIQEDLNAAMGRMDISAANDAYRQLNSIMGDAERNIRDNINAQEQFNQTVAASGSAYDGLADRLAEIAGAIGIGLAIQNAAQMAYESAAQLEATEAKYNTVFAGMTSAADQFMARFQALTPATTAEVRSMASSLQDLLIPMGLQRAEATAMTGDYMHIIGALTNFNSATVRAEDVAASFQSALTGEYDSLKGLGIQINETIVKQQAVAMGLAANINAVNNAAKAQAVLELAYRQSGDALAAYNAEALDTTTRMQLLQKGFQDTFSLAGQTLLPQINVALARVQTYMPQITAGIYTFIGVFSEFIQVATGAFSLLMTVGQAVADNWSWLGPTIGAATAAMITYKATVIGYNTVQAISNGLQAIAAAREAFKTGVTIAGTAATFAETAAQYGLNAALLACPLTWIAIAIMAVVAVIAIWIHRVVGIKVAWLICVNAILTYIDIYKMAFMSSCHSIQNSIDNMLYGFAAFKVGVLNTLGNLKVMGLTILQDFINGAIDRINRLITLTNSIAGTSIEVISHVEFAANAAVEEKGKQQQRAADLAAQREVNIQNKKERAQADYWRKYQASQNRLQREAAIEAAKKERDQKAGAKAGSGGMSAAEQAAMNDVVNNTGGTAANTAAMADSMDAMDEELKYMRDAAEQEVINRFTLAELKVDVNNNNTLKTENDFNMINRMLGNVTAEILASAAEGGHI